MCCESNDRETAYFYDAEEAREWLAFKGGGVVKKRDNKGPWVAVQTVAGAIMQNHFANAAVAEQGGLNA